MSRPVPTASVARRYTSQQYFGLVAEGVLAPDDRVELLEGVIVAMSPHNPRHASGVQWASEALFRAVGTRAVVRVQLSFVAGEHSVPEPDLAVVPGEKADYLDAHPTTAFLIIEVADTSLLQDRLTKAPLYAAAAVPEYWIVNLVEHRVEIFRRPDPRAGTYGETSTSGPGDVLELVALPGVRVSAYDLLPSRPD